MAEPFVRRLAERIGAVRIGRGTRAGVGLGPMICARHVARLGDLVADALARGARQVLGGGPVPGAGHFFAPVVLADVPDDARVMREEIFGPVTAIGTFAAEDEVLRRANDHEAGLAAYLYTRDLGRAMRVAGALEAGMVAVNRARVSCVATPFAGLKESGYGHAGGPEGLDDYLVGQVVSVPDPLRS